MGLAKTGRFGRSTMVKMSPISQEVPKSQLRRFCL